MTRDSDHKQLKNCFDDIHVFRILTIEVVTIAIKANNYISIGRIGRTCSIISMVKGLLNSNYFKRA